MKMNKPISKGVINNRLLENPRRVFDILELKQTVLQPLQSMVYFLRRKEEQTQIIGIVHL